jgi:hypothetical protein
MMDVQRLGNQYKDRTFMGVVVNNLDPMRLERIKVRIRDLFDGVEDEDLPWVAPKVAKGLGNGGGSRVCAVPYMQSLIYVEFENGDPNFPRYVGSPVTPTTRGDMFDTNYPNRYGRVDPKGNYMYTDMISGEFKFHHHSGTETTIADNGRVTIKCVENTDVDITGNANILIHGNAKIGVGGTAQIDVSGGITSSSPSWTHTGNVKVVGNHEVVGNSKVSGSETVGSLVIL